MKNALLTTPCGLGLFELDTHLIRGQRVLCSSTGSPIQHGWGKTPVYQDDKHLSSPCPSPPLTQGELYLVFAENCKYSRLSAQNDNSAATALPTEPPFRRYNDPYMLKDFDSYPSPSYSEQLISACTPESLGQPDSRYAWSYQSPDAQSTYSYSDSYKTYSTPTTFESSSLIAAAFDGVLMDPLISPSVAGIATQYSDHAISDVMKDLAPSQLPSSNPGITTKERQSRTKKSTVEEGKAFACTRCPYRSLRRVNYKAHEKTHSPRTPRVRVACSYGNGCPRTFNRKTDMDRHVTNVSRVRFIMMCLLMGGRST